MRLKNIPRARDVISDSQWVVKDPEACRGTWADIFGNPHPIHLEIGTGKGRFILELAQLPCDEAYCIRLRHAQTQLPCEHVVNRAELVLDLVGKPHQIARTIA